MKACVHAQCRCDQHLLVAPSTAFLYLPAYSGIAPLDSKKIAIALPMTSWMSHPMIAISIMIHISNLGALGYSVLQTVTCCYCVGRKCRHVKLSLNDTPYKHYEHLVMIRLCCSPCLLWRRTSWVHLRCSASKGKLEEPRRRSHKSYMHSSEQPQA